MRLRPSSVCLPLLPLSSGVQPDLPGACWCAPSDRHWSPRGRSTVITRVAGSSRDVSWGPILEAPVSVRVQLRGSNWVFPRRPPGYQWSALRSRPFVTIGPHSPLRTGSSRQPHVSAHGQPQSCHVVGVLRVLIRAGDRSDVSPGSPAREEVSVPPGSYSSGGHLQAFGGAKVLGGLRASPLGPQTRCPLFW